MRNLKTSSPVTQIIVSIDRSDHFAIPFDKILVCKWLPVCFTITFHSQINVFSGQTGIKCQICEDSRRAIANMVINVILQFLKNSPRCQKFRSMAGWWVLVDVVDSRNRCVVPLTFVREVSPDPGHWHFSLPIASVGPVDPNQVHGHGPFRQFTPFGQSDQGSITIARTYATLS